MISIVTNDNVTFEINDQKYLKLSLFINDMFEEYENEDDIVIPLTIDSITFDKIFDYMKHMADNNPSEIEKPMKKNFINYVTEWEFNYINVSMNELENIINASNYLNIRSLLNLSCAFLVSKIQNKSIDEIREILGIENDFTPEEEEKIIEENKWIDDL